MDRFRTRRLDTVGVVLLMCWLWAAPSSAAAQIWDPAAAIAAYSAALNRHDLESGLALFDEYGSATDVSGRHYEGRAGLTEFLLANGFGSRDASIITVSLQVVANRAIWTYSCSCSAAPTDVRMVLNHDKISVFAMMLPAAPPIQRANAGGRVRWMVGLALMASVLLAAFQFGRRRERAPRTPPRPSQGRLMAALTLYRPGCGASDRVELPAAAITSLRDSEDSAGPCSR